MDEINKLKAYIDKIQNDLDKANLLLTKLSTQVLKQQNTSQDISLEATTSNSIPLAPSKYEDVPDNSAKSLDPHAKRGASNLSNKSIESDKAAASTETSPSKPLVAADSPLANDEAKSDPKISNFKNGSEENKHASMKGLSEENPTSKKRSKPENRPDAINKNLSLENNHKPSESLATEVQKPQNKPEPSKPLAADQEDGAGEEGYFDGFSLVTKDGQKFEVPPNYAAKSKLIYGDELKRIDKDGRKLFKHINKIDRKEVEGLLTKIDSDWYFVCASGQYRISNVAAEFQNATEGVEAQCLLPANIPEATFAALDKVISTESVPQAGSAGASISTSNAPGNPSVEANPDESRPLGEFNPRVVLDEDLR